MTPQHFFQGLILLLSAASMWMIYRFLSHHPNRWPYMVAPGSWLMHLIVFYTVIFVRDFVIFIPADYVLWSAIVRLQAVFTMLGILTLLAYEKILFRV